MTDSQNVPNALTFDLEHWHTATLVRDSVSDPTNKIESSVERVLALLDKHDVTATFFVVGEIAEDYPDLIAQVADEGHELATHGYTHTPLFDLDRETFAAELDRSVAAIEQAADVDIRGFRAPNFSVTPETAWAFDVLSEKGFVYDASVFPVWTPMYGVKGAPVGPYRVDQTAPFSDQNQRTGDGLLEVPVAVHPRLKLPVAGGFYARLFRTRLLKWGINALHEKNMPAVLYFHPWEFNPAVSSSEPPIYARFISYHGVHRLTDTLDELLFTYDFNSVESLVDEFDR